MCVTRLVRFAISLVFAASGCTSNDLDERTRSDNTKVMMIKNFDRIWPEVAKPLEVELAGVSATLKGVELKATDVAVREKVFRLYEEKDQLSAQLQLFARTAYLSYINSEFDPDPQLRKQGRDQWNRAIETLHAKALKIREQDYDLRRDVGQYLRQEGKATQIAAKHSSSVEGLSGNEAVLTGDDKKTIAEFAEAKNSLNNRLDAVEAIFSPPKVKKTISDSLLRNYLGHIAKMYEAGQWIKVSEIKTLGRGGLLPIDPAMMQAHEQLTNDRLLELLTELEGKGEVALKEKQGEWLFSLTEKCCH